MSRAGQPPLPGGRVRAGLRVVRSRDRFTRTRRGCGCGRANGRRLSASRCDRDSAEQSGGELAQAGPVGARRGRLRARRHARAHQYQGVRARLSSAHATWSHRALGSDGAGGGGDGGAARNGAAGAARRAASAGRARAASSAVERAARRRSTCSRGRARRDGRSRPHTTSRRSECAVPGARAGERGTGRGGRGQGGRRRRGARGRVVTRGGQGRSRGRD